MPGFLHFVAKADGWDPDIVQMHLRWERPVARPTIPELTLDATVGGYEYQGTLLFEAPRAALRKLLRGQSMDDRHCESLVCGELAHARCPLLHLRLIHGDGRWSIAPQCLLPSWPLTLPKPGNQRFASERDAYRLIAWLMSSLDGFGSSLPDP